MQKGYIKLHRRCEDHPFYNEYRPATKREAWEDILLNVNHAEKQVLIGNKVFTCKRGESLHSLDWWQRKFKWASKCRVRTFFKTLEKMNQIQYANETQTVRISVCNYEFYQGYENGNKTEIKRIENALSTHVDPNNNDKNDKNENKRVSSGFQKPTIEEIKKHIDEKSYHVDAVMFWNFYESKNWMIGKNKMTNFKSALVTWENKIKDKPKAKGFVRNFANEN